MFDIENDPLTEKHKKYNNNNKPFFGKFYKKWPCLKDSDPVCELSCFTAMKWKKQIMSAASQTLEPS